MKKILLAAYCILFASFLFSQQINVSNLQKHIKYLASDKLKGRATGSKEELTAANYIANNFQKFKLTQKGNNNSYLYSYSFKRPKTPHDTVGGEVVQAVDVAGYLDNGAEYTVIIGGHFDHLGMGKDHNSLDANPEGKIHNGADDNASGTAGVIELARYFSQNERKEKFNFLFICFSGEELGLYGSKKFCDNPTIDFSKVNYMINMDMIGRLADSTKKLIIYGVGTAPDWVPMITKIPSEFSIKKDSAGIGPSDQTSFYLKDIPVLHFFTGQHPDYHKPSDDWQKINFDGEKMVLDYIIKVEEETEKLPRLIFQKTKNPEEGKSSFKVTMGVMPDYTFEGKGMRIDGVTDEKPAAKAGLKKGDVVVQMGEIKVGNMMDYMKALSANKKGDTVPVTVIRDGKEVKVNVTF
ncbi:MAG: M20/M25/M40 family metallo-hydrolase [Bacteroidetes bacterium]|nr:M20/M25/M40 family metallo-hydrolase [Bacteroidota bacterium]